LRSRPGTGIPFPIMRGESARGLDTELYGETNEKDSSGPRSLWPTHRFQVNSRRSRNRTLRVSFRLTAFIRSGFDFVEITGSTYGPQVLYLHKISADKLARPDAEDSRGFSVSGPKNYLRRNKVAARFLLCLAILYPWIIRRYVVHGYQDLPLDEMLFAGGSLNAKLLGASAVQREVIQ
jgi:hypothetical protein